MMILRSHHLSRVIVVKPGVVGAGGGARAERLTLALAPEEENLLLAPKKEIFLLAPEEENLLPAPEKKNHLLAPHEDNQGHQRK